MPSERIIWGFSVFDILTTLLLSSHGVPQIFILKREKKKKENPPQSISSTALAAEASHITFRGELAGCGSVCLFIYFWQRHSHSL